MGLRRPLPPCQFRHPKGWRLGDGHCDSLFLMASNPRTVSLLPTPLLLLAQRSDCKDVVTIYDCASWAPLSQFGVSTHDLADLAWSPDGSCLAVWDSPAYSYTGGAAHGASTADGARRAAMSGWLGAGLCTGCKVGRRGR